MTWISRKLHSVDSGGLYLWSTVIQGSSQSNDGKTSRAWPSQDYRLQVLHPVSPMGISLTWVDQNSAAEYLYWQDIATEIEARLKDSSSTTIMKRQMGRIQTFPNVLAKLTMTFDKLIFPLEVKFDLLWGMIYLNLKASKSSYYGEDAANGIRCLIHHLIGLNARAIYLLEFAERLSSSIDASKPAMSPTKRGLRSWIS